MNRFLNFKTQGQPTNSTIVIVHGLFGSLDNWQSLAKKWSESYYVLSVDVRNHGKSFHSDNMEFEALAKDLFILIQKEGIGKIHLLGHSMGGKIAMEFAIHYPEYLASLIVVDVAPYAYTPHHSDVFEMIKTTDLSKFTSRQEIETEIKKYLHQEDVVQFMMKNIRRNGENLLFEWKFNAKVLDRDYLSLIQYIPHKGFNGPTLFIGGERSKYISKETSIHIFELYPEAKFEFVSNAGHWVHADNPTEFYNLVTQFITKTSTLVDN